MHFLTGVIISLCIAALASGSLFELLQVTKQDEDIIGIRIGNSSTAFNQEFFFSNKYSLYGSILEEAVNRTTYFTDCSTSKELCLHNFNTTDGNYLTITPWKDECVFVNYSSKFSTWDALAASFDIHNVHVYGGPLNPRYESYRPIVWPSEKNNFDNNPYMYIPTGEEIRYYHAVLEPYWLFSSGLYVYVDSKVPLFFELNENTLDLSAKYIHPYFREDRLFIALTFTMCKLNDARQAHQHAIKHFLGTPSKLPDLRLVTQPGWSTWNSYYSYNEHVNQTGVIDVAEKAIENGYGGGRFVIDHKWETYYGSFKPDSTFPDFKGLINRLKNLNFSVALSVHPFVSSNYFDHSVQVDLNLTKNEIKDYLTKGEYPAFFHGVESGSYVDSSNPGAWNWFQKRLLQLRETYGFNSFDFDHGNYGGSTFEKVPNLFTIIQENTKLLASLDSNIVTNVVRGTQKDAIVLSMSLESEYTQIYVFSEPFLRTIIARLLQMNILGYSFVLPNTIGSKLEKYNGEEFIRAVQLRVFMPFMQFSINRPPWSYDEKIANLTKKFVDLHANYSWYIIELMKENVMTGAPVNPPIWWISPNDPIALGCTTDTYFTWDGKSEPKKSVCRFEFLLGDRILVAPVLQKGQRKRDIYLPEGYWRDGNSEKTYDGPTWLEDYPADLDILPYFLRLWPHPFPRTNVTDSSSRSSSYQVTASAVLILAISLLNGLADV